MRKLRESIAFDDTLYQYIVECLGNEIDNAIVDYENGYNNLYDKVEVKYPIRYQLDDNTLIYGNYIWVV